MTDPPRPVDLAPSEEDAIAALLAARTRGDRGTAALGPVDDDARALLDTGPPPVTYQPVAEVTRDYTNDALYRGTAFGAPASDVLLRLPPAYRQPCAEEAKRRLAVYSGIWPHLVWNQVATEILDQLKAGPS